MTLNSRLNWEEHIYRVRAKAKKTLNTIKVVAGKKWRGDLRTLKRSKIDYGCQVYSTASPGRLKNIIAYIEKV